MSGIWGTPRRETLRGIPRRDCLHVHVCNVHEAWHEERAGGLEVCCHLNGGQGREV